MNKLITRSLIFFSSLAGSIHYAVAQSEDLNHFYLGNRLGLANSIEISDRGNTAELENDGLAVTYIVGYKLDSNWSFELGMTVLEDFNLGVLVSDDDIDLTGRYLAANYTHFVNDSRFFVRGRGGLIDWEAEAAERSIIFGIDLAPEGAAGPYRNSGVAPLLGAEIGVEFGKWFEWTILGIDAVPSGDAQWTTAHTGFKFSF
ncbi:outer membrane beta-barrel protein [Microbulbifer rhizosphaerae]|uniref:Outer membrane protein beta-barrel domain-containing protein n=1 Tax=Microbulbifer rhizosphaerae TaxID=1562603 RepID=A0A7W4WGB7_9GAMM|nr:hypothetical protein [Microbulbifer rhizosphaerae]MBB3063663.1 hypothetical protein [Microbulbifer rhizosphaerae]